MDNEAQTPAWTRLERAIALLEDAVSNRRERDADAKGARSDAPSEDPDLARRHAALKSAVAACISDIDALIEDGGNGDA